jgi:hypothetical protein
MKEREAVPKKGDVAIRNANIITMNPQRPRAEALAVREGRIVAVGSWQHVASYAEGMPVIDLTGQTVLPGFIDTHAHFLWTALSLAALDVSDAKDHSTLEAIVRQAVADAPPGELILGMGFTEYALDTERFSPIIEALDTVAADPETLDTGRPGLFAAGDCVTGPLNVLDAVAAGRQAALAMDRTLRGEAGSIALTTNGTNESLLSPLPPVDSSLDHLEWSAASGGGAEVPRHPMPALLLEERRGLHREVELGTARSRPGWRPSVAISATSTSLSRPSAARCATSAWRYARKSVWKSSPLTGWRTATSCRG